LICPEFELELGLPREPIRIVNQMGDDRLIQPAIKRDLTRKMARFCDDFPSGHSPVPQTRSSKCVILIGRQTFRLALSSCCGEYRRYCLKKGGGERQRNPQVLRKVYSAA